MKITNVKTVASIALVGLMSIGTASAASVAEGVVTTIPTLDESSSLNISLNEGVATVYGEVDTLADSIETKKFVEGLDGVVKVVNRLNVTWPNAPR